METKLFLAVRQPSAEILPGFCFVFFFVDFCGGFFHFTLGFSTLL